MDVLVDLDGGIAEAVVFLCLSMWCCMQLPIPGSRLAYEEI